MQWTAAATAARLGVPAVLVERFVVDVRGRAHALGTAPESDMSPQ